MTGTMNLIDTHGVWNGGSVGYDMIRITCTTLGAYGVAKCKVEYYGDEKLFGSETTDNLVTGGYDSWPGMGGLLVRFQGSAMAVSDLWEIEVHSSGMELTNSTTGTIQLSRQ